MGNGEWGTQWQFPLNKMGIKQKSPSSSLSKRLHPLSQLYSPLPLPTPHSSLLVKGTIEGQGGVAVDFLATDFEGGNGGV
jgi:hypothetical protein